MIATSNYITISDSASSVPLALSTQFPAIKLAGALVLAVACSTSGLNVYVDPTMRGDTPQFLVSQQDSFGLEASAITYNGNTLTERRVDMKSQGDNLQELISFLKLEENWDYQGASAFSQDLIEKIQGILLCISVQPELMPTPRDSIQFEYETEKGDYLEIELFASGEAIVLDAPAEGKPTSYPIPFTIEEINRVVDAFYVRSAR